MAQSKHLWPLFAHLYVQSRALGKLGLDLRQGKTLGLLATVFLLNMPGSELLEITGMPLRELESQHLTAVRVGNVEHAPVNAQALRKRDRGRGI